MSTGTEGSVVLGWGAAAFQCTSAVVKAGVGPYKRPAWAGQWLGPVCRCVRRCGWASRRLRCEHGERVEGSGGGYTGPEHGRT